MDDFPEDIDDNTIVYAVDAPETWPVNMCEILKIDIESSINRNGFDSKLNLPDHLIAEYLMDALCHLETHNERVANYKYLEED